MLRRLFILANAGHIILDGVDPEREHLSMGEPERNYQTYPWYRWVVCHPHPRQRRRFMLPAALLAISLTLVRANCLPIAVFALLMAGTAALSVL